MPFLPDKLPDDLNELEEIIADHESEDRPLKRGAEAQISWDGQHKEKTPYSIVYLHGFKSTHPEGDPVHRHVSRHFGCNLYLARLYGHGQITTKKFQDLTADKLIQSAADAYRVGKKIGDKVILMGTSTGGTLALQLAASASCQPHIAGIILYSPLIHLYGIQSLLLENRLFRSILKIIPGERYIVRSEDPFTPRESNIWYRSYRLKGALALGELVQNVIKPSLFKRITCPAFFGYYYKNKHNHDRVVSTAAIKRIARQLGTPSERLLLKNFTNANSHVLCNSLLSNAVQDVTEETITFIEKNIRPIMALKS